MGKPRGGGGSSNAVGKVFASCLRRLARALLLPRPSAAALGRGKGGVKQLAGLGLAAERRARTYIYTHTHIYNIHDQRFFPWGPGKSRDLSQALRRAGGRERRSLGGGHSLCGWEQPLPRLPNGRPGRSSGVFVRLKPEAAVCESGSGLGLGRGRDGGEPSGLLPNPRGGSGALMCYRNFALKAPTLSAQPG